MPVADFTQLIHWLAPTDRAAPDPACRLAHRTAHPHRNDQTRENQKLPCAGTRSSRWGPGRQGDHQWSELRRAGLRLPESFNHIAKFQNSANQPYTGPNTQNATPAGGRVAGVMKGHGVMLAMFGRPEMRGATPPSSHDGPFAYCRPRKAWIRSRWSIPPVTSSA